MRRVAPIPIDQTPRLFEVVTSAEWKEKVRSQWLGLHQALRHLLEGEKHVKVPCEPKRLSQMQRNCLSYARRLGIFVATHRDPMGWLWITRLQSTSTRGGFNKQSKVFSGKAAPHKRKETKR